MLEFVQISLYLYALFIILDRVFFSYSGDGQRDWKLGVVLESISIPSLYNTDSDLGFFFSLNAQHIAIYLSSITY